jgi:hypothetical protein
MHSTPPGELNLSISVEYTPESMVHFRDFQKHSVRRIEASAARL